jgi:hypothetical protein
MMHSEPPANNSDKVARINQKDINQHLSLQHRSLILKLKVNQQIYIHVPFHTLNSKRLVI